HDGLVIKFSASLKTSLQTFPFIISSSNNTSHALCHPNERSIAVTQTPQLPQLPQKKCVAQKSANPTMKTSLCCLLPPCDNRGFHSALWM
ncbi:MAG TPA: hypothetical protein VN761_00875, partial [Candidatus Polarisedimenticolia bacterium]|nr:hypothetical protein [Candidatus Polarisedimenticolia bacterium]